MNTAEASEMDAQRQPSKPRAGSKLINRRRKLHRMLTSQMPTQLQHGDDAQEDVTAPSRGNAAGAQYMHQSIFSMITAAGARTDFNNRFDESSESEHEEDEPGAAAGNKDALPSKAPLTDVEHVSEKESRPRSPHRKHLSKSKIFRPLSSLRRKDKKSSAGKRLPSPSSDGSSDTSKSNPRDASMMSRLLTAEAEFQATDVDVERNLTREEQEKARARADSSPATLLATRLAEIFSFGTPETVVAEYPCWLLQSVLLQGYMYITRKHVCFYAYLPRRSKSVSQSGILSKKARSTSKYHRSWFSLKGDVLSYYANSSDLYFPQGNIDLRYGISANLAVEKEKQKDCKDFTLTTDHRTYHFRADSASSAREWVRSLQKTIFRSHNDGDSVKISLPIENVIDIEVSPVVEFAETVKIRVIESGESYAIDDYFFSFFSNGNDAIDALGSLMGYGGHVRNQLVSQGASDEGQRSPRTSSPGAQKRLNVLTQPERSRSITPVRENVRATMRPFGIDDTGRMSPRMSGDPNRSTVATQRHSVEVARGDYGRASFDRGRRSESSSRPAAVHFKRSERSPLAPKHDPDDSTDPPDTETDSSVAFYSPTARAHMSASQILDRSDVFQSPTLNRLETLASMSSGDARRHSDDTAQSSSPQNDGKSSSDLHNRPPPLNLHSRGRSPGHAVSEDVTGLARNTPSPSLQEIMKAGAYPLQRAGAFAGYLRNRSSRLATESMTYIEKVSGMWAGQRKHYGDNEGVIPDDRDVDPEDDEANVGHGDRFRAHFALPASEKLQATYFGYLHRVLPLYGKIYVSNRKFCFRSLLPGTRTKLVLPLKDIENVDKEKGFRFGYHGLVLVIRGHEELFFEFRAAEHRDDCTVTLLQSLESWRFIEGSHLLAKDDEDHAETAKHEHKLLQEARRLSATPQDVVLPETTETVYDTEDTPQILFEDPRAQIINFKPTAPLRITCLTIGSRGDVQPYIALCKGLKAEGHIPRIATHAEFGPWVQKHGIEFEPVDGDPAELMRICVENGMFTYSFLKEASSKFRTWIDELLISAWKACQNSDVLIESPSAMAGIHIAEALGIPYYRAFTMPWTRTRAYPHAFAVPEHKIGGAYNYFSYVMFDNVFWKAIAGQVNRWRQKELGLRSTNLDKMQPNKVPFLYNFSPHVVVPPLDYSDWVRVTGYWFLDEGTAWKPPAELTEFIAKARADKKKLVYIGFGSIVVSDPAALTRTVKDSVLRADVRCILSKGWSDRLGDPSAVKSEVPLPPEILQIKSAPHDWLFTQIDAAVHHGGAGTTGASLRAGVPTVIKPFFGDQFFFGSRVEDLGVGICLKKVNVSVFSKALWEATHSERMISKARVLGERIRKEDGVQTAIQAIYRDLDYAKSLIKARDAPGVISQMPHADDEAGEIEESWTFIGDESDPELRGRIQNWGAASQLGARAPRVSLNLDSSARALHPVEATGPTRKGSEKKK